MSDCPRQTIFQPNSYHNVCLFSFIVFWPATQTKSYTLTPCVHHTLSSLEPIFTRSLQPHPTADLYCFPSHLTGHVSVRPQPHLHTVPANIPASLTSLFMKASPRHLVAFLLFDAPQILPNPAWPRPAPLPPVPCSRHRGDALIDQSLDNVSSLLLH